MNSTTLIDRFVETVNRLPREKGTEDEIPPSVRGHLIDPEAWTPRFEWHIKPWPNIDWIEPLERKMGVTLPPSFRSLVLRYIFPRFEAGEILLNANTPEGVFAEFRDRVFGDPTFAKVLLPQGYIPFANPSTGSYDPICFDTQRQRGVGECPLVRIEHERVLCEGVIGDKQEIAPSFAAFVDDFLRTHNV